MTRWLRLFVIVTQVLAWGLGTAGLCVCADASAAEGHDCCAPKQVVTSGEDCCAPGRDELTSATTSSFERAAALDMPTRVVSVGAGLTLRPTAVSSGSLSLVPPLPALVLRI